MASAEKNYKKQFMKLQKFISLILVFGITASSQAETKKLTLEELRGYAFKQSPLTKSIELDFATQNKDALETEALKNPEIDFLYAVPAAQRGSDGRGDQPQLILSQPIRISDFGTRGEVSRLIKASASVDQKLSLLELSQKIRLSFAKVWALQERKKLLSSAKARLNKASGIVKKSVAGGLVGDGQALAFEAESNKLEALELGLDGEIQESIASLVKLTTYYDTTDITAIRPVSIQIPSEEYLIAKIEDQDFPPNARSRLRGELADAQYSLAKKDSYPTLTPKFFYGKDPGGFDQVGGGIAFEIPLWYSNEGEIQRASASKSLSQSQREYFSSDAFKAELLATRKVALLYEKQASLYETQVIPKLQQSLKALSNQYEAGSASVFEVLQSQREQISAEGDWLELVIKSISARAELSILTGEEI